MGKQQSQLGGVINDIRRDQQGHSRHFDNDTRRIAGVPGNCDLVILGLAISRIEVFYQTQVCPATRSYTQPRHKAQAVSHRRSEDDGVALPRFHST
jgi:hypothetical protein